MSNRCDEPKEIAAEMRMMADRNEHPDGTKFIEGQLARQYIRRWADRLDPPPAEERLWVRGWSWPRDSAHDTLVWDWSEENPGPGWQEIPGATRAKV